ncbi:MAG: protein-glutamate O-methyltransferase family protein [Rivularia sp. (in: Bacteria)]|nr:protein-glutamate O-methyltransferase family protein [Rivularia sp. MS3]
MHSKYSAPKLDIPPSLIASVDGGFTEHTVINRMPNIARRVIKENNFADEINQSLEKLASDLSSGNLSPLIDDTGIDVMAWPHYLQLYQEKRWVDIPWFVAETYFYRLILNITNYFRPGEYQYIDPFNLQKSQGLEKSIDSIVALCKQASIWCSQADSTETSLIGLLYFSLWGNRVDLSLWSAIEDSDRSNFNIESQQAHILVDDSAKVIDLFVNNTSNKQNQVDLVADNAGFELVCDLCLLDFLLNSGLVDTVKLHLKPHPTFVSDAMIKDVHHTVDFLSSCSSLEVKNFAHRLRNYITSEQLILTDDYFWTSPLPFWEIPESKKNELSNSSLLIVKGDANYRRLLGDRHWHFSSNFMDIVCYLPVPTLALRTLKSEVAAGIPQLTIDKTAKSDPDWLTNGSWGLIQLAAI